MGKLSVGELDLDFLLDLLMKNLACCLKYTVFSSDVLESDKHIF